MQKRLHAYDVIMTLAVATMLIDHTGHFFVDWEVLRTVGRLAAPLFLFLAGYGRNHVRPGYVWWGFLLTPMLSGYPLDILITFFLLAVSYHYVLRKLSDFSVLMITVMLSVTLTVIQLESSFYLSYSGVALLYFMSGKYLYHNRLPLSAGYLTVAVFFQFSGYYYTYTNTWVVMLTGGLIFVLHRYLSTDGRVSFNPFTRFVARYSLQIYISHIVVFFVLQRGGV